MTVSEYKVTLDSFEGPLDLLLFLIRKNEVEITDIPVATITQQYLDHLAAGGGIDRIDIETAGEFLVMAATLMEIKSRMLTPAPTPEGEATDTAVPVPADPRAELVQQLLAYKKYRDAAGALEQRRETWERRFAAGPAGAAEAPEAEADDAVDLEDADVMDLVRAFAAIIETVDFARVGDHHVTDDETPIELHAEDILDRLRHETASGSDGAAAIDLRRIFAGRTRAEAIGLFLALLELVRQRKIEAVQDAINGAIGLRLIPDTAE